MGRLEEGEPLPTLADLTELRDQVSEIIEAEIAKGPSDEDVVFLAAARLGIKLGYMIVGALLSIAESQRILAAEAEMTMQEAEEREQPDQFETL